MKAFGIFQLRIASGETGAIGLRAAKVVEVELRLEAVKFFLLPKMVGDSVQENVWKNPLATQRSVDPDVSSKIMHLSVLCENQPHYSNSSFLKQKLFILKYYEASVTKVHG